MTPSPYSRFFQKGFNGCFDESQKYLNVRFSLKNYGSTMVLFLVCFGGRGEGIRVEDWRIRLHNFSQSWWVSNLASFKFWDENIPSYHSISISHWITYFLSFSHYAQERPIKHFQKMSLNKKSWFCLLDVEKIPTIELIAFTARYDSPFLYSSSVFCQVQTTSFPFKNLS